MKKENFKYKKEVAEAISLMNNELFKFRHSHGLKQLTNEDALLKKKVEQIQFDFWKLQDEIEAQLLYKK
tara:strand:- start:250 stop:456 length:207 start_codon:yes stop_codon:yes gene_type:complete